MIPWLILGPVAAGVAGLATGSYLGVQYESGQQAKADIKAKKLRDDDAKEFRVLLDKQSKPYIIERDLIAERLRHAQTQVSLLSRTTACLPSSFVSMLNAPGNVPAMGTTPRLPENPPATAATDSSGFASAQSIGESLAICRARYEALAIQVNTILDIEDSRDRIFSTERK